MGDRAAGKNGFLLHGEWVHRSLVDFSFGFNCELEYRDSDDVDDQCDVEYDVESEGLS